MSNYCTNCKWLGKETNANHTFWLCRKNGGAGYMLQSLCGNPTKLLSCINKNWYEAKVKQEDAFEYAQRAYKEVKYKRIPLEQKEKTMNIKVIMFTSTSCLPCTNMKPVLSSVCDELSIPLDFVWKESDKENSFNRYNVLSVPTFLIMSKKEDQWLPVNSYIGTKSRTELLNLLIRYKETE